MSTKTTERFNYRAAFDRNIGWVTEAEQDSLRSKRVAIAGMGGVGGIHLITLARLGIGNFNLADFDRFDIVNFNRQAGATMASIGRPKLDVMVESALEINPEADIIRFPEGVQPDNIDAFLRGVDLFVDGFDFFALGIRAKVFARCNELGIPAVTAAPIGLGTGYLAFVPGQMTFEQYFRLDGQPEEEQFLRFLMGVAPRGLHRQYLVDPSRINLAERRGPSTAAACQLCAGVTGALALQLLLNRPGVKAAPYHQHFDAYRGVFAVTKLPQGNDSLMQRARLALVRRAFRTARSKAVPTPVAEAPPATLAERVVDFARWAPSGDNSQPWRFEILGDDTLRILLTTESGENPYDYKGGEPSLLSCGMLLETLRIAASREQHRLEWTVEEGAEPYRILVRLIAAPDLAEDPLSGVVRLRSVDRTPYLPRALREHERLALQASAGPEIEVRWEEPRRRRVSIARLGMLATDIRLRARETFDVHRKVIDWTGQASPTGMPARAIGLDPATLRLMRWSMQRWTRVDRINRLFGTLMAGTQLDLRTGLGSAAFFMMRPLQKAEGAGRVDTLLRQGAAIQRFWLTATRLGLAMQPAFATLIFAHYGETGVPFTADPRLARKARTLAERFAAVTGGPSSDYVFMGRIGQPRVALPRVRSTRRSVRGLLTKDS